MLSYVGHVVQQLLKRFREKSLSALYQLSGWVLGIAVFAIIFSLTEKYLGLKDTIAVYVAIFGAAIIVAIVAMPIDTRKRQRFFDTFFQAMKLPAKPISLATGEPTPFTEDWGTVLWIPEAAIRLDADNASLHIVSYDLSYDVLLPIAMITQVEFDPGDGPPKRRRNGMSWKREWLGLPFAPTVYLGIKCALQHELVVYPLCFHPDLEDHAEMLHAQLKKALESVEQSASCPLSAQALEERLPPSFESRFLRTHILQRFWPDYRGNTLREWLNR